MLYSQYREHLAVILNRYYGFMVCQVGPAQSEKRWRRQYSGQMNTKKLPQSIRHFIRREKARIRRDVPNPEEQKKLIRGLYVYRQR